jgi:hypothetical protein
MKETIELSGQVYDCGDPSSVGTVGKPAAIAPAAVI